MTKDRYCEIYEYLYFGTKNGEQIIDDLQKRAKELATRIVEASDMLVDNKRGEKLGADVRPDEIAQTLFSEVLIELTNTYASR